MSRSASEIEREVEATRASVEETVEALKEKMTLGQMVDEAAGYFRTSGGPQIFSNLGNQVRENPLPLALVGFGLVWLMSGRRLPQIPPVYPYARGGGRREGYGAYDYRLMAEEDEAVYAGASHPDYAEHSVGFEETWLEDETERSRSGNGMRRRLHDTRDKAAGAASGVIGAASRLASGIGSAASAIGSAAASAASGARSGAGAAVRGGSTAYRGASRLGAGAVEGAAHYGSGMYRGASRLGAGAYSGATRFGSGAYSGASRLGSSAYSGASRFGSSAYSGASRFGSSAYSGASRLGYRTRDTFADVLEREPLALGAFGLAIGAALGALLPRTATEDRLMGEWRDELLEDAEAYGREQYERGRRVAEEAYRAAWQQVDSQGLSPDKLKEKVGELARAAIERAREGAEQVYQTAWEEAEAQGLAPSSFGERSGTSETGGSEQFGQGDAERSYQSSSAGSASASVSSASRKGGSAQGKKKGQDANPTV
jgi:hypothetical protein